MLTQGFLDRVMLVPRWEYYAPAVPFVKRVGTEPRLGRPAVGAR